MAAVVWQGPGVVAGCGVSRRCPRCAIRGPAARCDAVRRHRCRGARGVDAIRRCLQWVDRDQLDRVGASAIRDRDPASLGQER